jgi:hydroxymethylpyrimidine pyrophosphatase-like HAD family hydrolase
MREGSRTRGAPQDGSLYALAVDLDRTLKAPWRTISPTARTALLFARAMGLKVVLASGRECAVLRAFAHDLGSVDALVAEDGAVVESPIGSTPRIHDRRLAAEVRQRLEGFAPDALEVGDVALSMPLRYRSGLSARLAGLPIDLVENVDKVMVQPRGISKATGLRSALARIGGRGAAFAAIGDAENDLPMLRAAALSGAVANAEPEVQAVAEYHCQRRYAAGVLEFVRGPVRARLGTEVRLARPARRD